jgi:hypothetical protein
MYGVPWDLSLTFGQYHENLSQEVLPAAAIPSRIHNGWECRQYNGAVLFRDDPRLLGIRASLFAVTYNCQYLTSLFTRYRALSKSVQGDSNKSNSWQHGGNLFK